MVRGLLLQSSVLLVSTIRCWSSMKQALLYYVVATLSIMNDVVSSEGMKSYTVFQSIHHPSTQHHHRKNLLYYYVLRVRTPVRVQFGVWGCQTSDFDTLRSTNTQHTTRHANYSTTKNSSKWTSTPPTTLIGGIIE